jgi:hypothetical protein
VLENDPFKVNQLMWYLKKKNMFLSLIAVQNF